MAAPSQIAHYRIVSKLGQGGMGVVYRATDTKLNRDVAIKLLPESFRQDAARMQRFEREAQVLASLNHPNIAAIYGVEQSAIVMELVEGRDLADRIAQGAIPIGEALSIAEQVAEGLEAAHERGVIHRDLKPANIRITSAGLVKLLDFGLARSAGGSTAPTGVPNPMQSPTMSLTMTQGGMILGTAAYMSPEQAAGKLVDKRADIWSFGVVMWEMLCGRRLFEGETVPHTLADVLRAEIDLGKLPASTPAPIRELIGRCLDRDVSSRLRDIGEARIAIQRWKAHPLHALLPATAAGTNTKLRWAAAAAALLAAAASYLAWKPASAPETVRLEMDAPPGAPIMASITTNRGLAFSPDGRTIAFFAGEGGKGKLWLRSLDAAGARAVEGTEGGRHPFWSPDSRFVGYCATVSGSDQVMKIAVAGGIPQTIATLPGCTAGSWGSSDVILLSTSILGGLSRVSSSGGPVRQATELDSARQETSHRWPCFLPDGRHFLFLDLSSDPTNSGIFVGLLDSSERTQLNSEMSSAQYVSGHLLFVRGQTLVAQPFDPSSRRFAGEPVPVFENVLFGSPIWHGVFSASDNGNLVALPIRPREIRQLTWLDRRGEPVDTVGIRGDLIGPELSPDGKKIGILRGHGMGPLSVAIVDPERAMMSSVGKDGALNVRGHLVFSPDGRRIAFSSNLGDEIHLMAVDGGAESKSPTVRGTPEDWSPDGRYLAYRSQQSFIWILPVAAGGEPFQFCENSQGGRFSPDGKWLAYVSAGRGTPQVYVEPFAGGPSSGTGRVQVSPAGGSGLRWSRDGKGLFYISPTNELMAAPVRLQPAFSVGVPKALFKIPAGVTYAVSPDGQRFLLNLPVEQPADPPVTVILNWPSLLKR